MQTLLLPLHLASTLFMAGLIWFVQVVHYPLFPAVGTLSGGEQGFVEYEKQHCDRTSFVVIPPMIIELITGLYSLFSPTLFRMTYSEAAFGVLLIACLWGSTFFLQVPCHQRLCNGFDGAVARRLVMTNWLRTALWSVRGIFVLYVTFR